METCAICNRKLTILNTGTFGNKLKTGERICLNCMKGMPSNLSEFTLEDISKYAKERLENIQQERVKREQEEKLNNSIIEYKRTCKQCGKVWHSLASREKYLKKEKSCNDCNMCVSAFGSAGGNAYSWGTWTQAKRNEHALNNEISRLNQCPNCMSCNYTEEIIAHEKK
jgi:hypothetical protein